MNRDYKLNMLFNAFAEELNITDTMLEKAETAYAALGDYLREANSEWDVVMYPQGSFALGTVVKPIQEEGQYDVDLVVLVKSPSMTASNLRVSIRKLLENHGRYEKKIEDKKPCIRIQYADYSQFHMDIACAKPELGKMPCIEIARYNDDSIYYYDPSNPEGYIEWFKRVMNYERAYEQQRRFYASTDIKKLRLPTIRTPLQKAIQILKRHRDIYYSERSDEYKPDSVIITTLCGLTYDSTQQYAMDSGDVYSAIVNMLRDFGRFIGRNANGEYFLSNPSYTQENFLKKWNEDVRYAEHFLRWVESAQRDILEDPNCFIEDNPAKLSSALERAFGKDLSEASLRRYGLAFGQLAKEGRLKYDPSQQTITTKSSDQDYRPHTYFGGEEI